MKITRRTKLLVVALALCFTTMIGSTFAWFTDTVESDVNTITAGNLDMVVEYKTKWADDWAPLTEKTKLFNESALWEPGHTEAVALRITNKGTLAFKYDYALNVISETPSVNVYDEEFKLSDSLDLLYTAINADGMIGDMFMKQLLSYRNKAQGEGMIMSEGEFGTFVVDSTAHLGSGESHVVGLSVSMPTTVGNEANHKTGTTAPSINFGLSVVATQAVSESDSFGNDYDKDALYPNETLVEGSNDAKAALMAAIDAAQPGDVLVLTEDATIAGYNATEKLVIEKNITLDLNGKTLTTECGWGGIDLKGGASIINGTIYHTGNTAAIKAFQVGKIENVTINVTETAGKTKGGIVVQNGDSYIGSIKNVTINGATNGIECWHSEKKPAIGSIDNVKINATQNGIYLNGAGIIGSISNSEIHGGSHGINAYLANLWHISLDIKNSTISGGQYGIDIWDEAETNTGSTVTFNYDDKTTFTGGTNNTKITLQEEITCTVNGVEQTTPCDDRK